MNFVSDVANLFSTALVIVQVQLPSTGLAKVSSLLRLIADQEKFEYLIYCFSPLYRGNSKSCISRGLRD
jgi:hypothetical protein